MKHPIPDFPSEFPTGYTQVAERIVFDGKKHLQLELPDKVWYLDEFGYSEKEIEQCASNVAVTSPFRLLSEEGVAALYEIANDLRNECTHLQGARTPNHLAGGVYRSRFLREMCSSPEILAHMSQIAGVALLPHSMPSQQIYINYPPDDVNKAVDAWHYDGIGFDYVIMVSDPAKLKGGNFEYFRGTRHEIAELADIELHQVRYGVTRQLPPERIIQTQFPDAGFAIFQQGNMVVHRAAKLQEPGDRITAVPGLVAEGFVGVDPTAKHDMPYYREPGIVSELARHSAWVAQSKLQQFIEDVSMTSDSGTVGRDLSAAIRDITDTLSYFENRPKGFPGEKEKS